MGRNRATAKMDGCRTLRLLALRAERFLPRVSAFVNDVNSEPPTVAATGVSVKERLLFKCLMVKFEGWNCTGMRRTVSASGA